MMTWESLLDEAAEALEQGQHHEALQLCDRAAVQGDDARYHAAILRGDVLIDFGDAQGALSSYETAADPDVVDPELDCARGIALFELGRLAEAENALKSALRGRDDLAEAFYALGLCAEIQGTGEEIEYFRRARRLDPERFPPAAQLSREAFEAVVEEALQALPAGLRGALEEVPVLIAELPHPDDLLHADPPLSPLALGMFVGIPPSLAPVSVDGGPPEQPAMVLFKRNLERAAPERDALVHEVRQTVLTEMGFALGLRDEEWMEHEGH